MYDSPSKSLSHWLKRTSLITSLSLVGLLPTALISTARSAPIDSPLGSATPPLFSPTTPDAQAQLGTSLGLSPFWDWKTIETDHFRLTFPKQLSGVAEKAANYFEEANSVLAPKLHWQPIHKTQVLLVDNADAANGLTTPVGRFGILLYITPPDDWFSTAYYDNWLRLLVFHEYTHLVNMDTTRDFWRVLRYGLGDVLLPNAIWPSWMLEGLAVYMETRYTHAGRGRSAYYEMILRSAVADNMLNNPKFITLDRVNGTNPYYPYGETAYTFGYQLMNEVARQDVGTRTADQDSHLKPGPAGHEGENMLGEMSYRSGRRVPFFINGNLENISGRDWYKEWSLMVRDARTRAHQELAKIRSQPESQIDPVIHRGTHGSWEVLGTAFSPDGRWMAYTQQSSDEPTSLYLLDRKTGQRKRIGQKELGATLAFTPDSRNLVFSELNRKGLYYLWSDLKSYSLDDGSIRSLSSSLRARDPDVSRDGKWVTFTVTRNATTGLAIAQLSEKDGKLRMEEPHKLFWPAQLDAVHAPKFSSDGNRIYFSWHVNGKVGEEIAVYDRTTRQVTPLIADGSLNRYPAIRPAVRGVAGSQDELYFVSDHTGVDNIYAYRDGKAVLVTNTETGLAFPSFDPDGKLYADVFSYKGWDVAKVEELTDVSQQAVTLAPPPAPPIDDKSTSHAGHEKYPIQDYSIFPSIWPRQWLPVFLLYPKGYFAGAQVAGFDATDRHRYILGGAYDSLVHAPQWLALYSNRSLGPDLTFSVENFSTNINTDPSTGNLLSYSSKTRFTANAELPIQWTFSSLTPIVSLNMEETYNKIPGANPSDNDIVSKGFWVPYVDTSLVYSNATSSPLAISPEQGRTAQIGSRLYFNSGSTYVKTLLQDTEYLRTDFLLKHSVLVPALSYSWVDRVVTDLVNSYSDSNVLVEGRQSGRLINSFPGTSLDQLVIRGYPLMTFDTKQAAVASLDYRFPIAHIFHGWGTNPAFLENLHGFVFGETAYFPGGRNVKTLPSAGGGLLADLTLLNSVPLTASVEYHKGFRQDYGGTGELFFQLNLSSPISF